jgi:hypothetical protein
VLRSATILLIACLALVACAPDPNDAATQVTGAPDAGSEATGRSGTSPGDADDQPGGSDNLDTAQRPGRILVFDLDAVAAPVTVQRADGSIVASLPTDPAAAVWLPSWTPDATGVVWAESLDGVTWFAVHATVGGTDRTSAPLPGRPDHVAFDESSGDLLVLAPSDAGFGLYRVTLLVPEEAAGATVADPLDRGAPFFSDIGGGGELIAHVGSETRLVTESGIRLLDTTGAAYQTPVWHVDGSSVLYARRMDGEPTINEILRLDLEGDDIEVIGAYRGFALFALDPSGSTLAVSVFGGERESGFDVLEVSHSRGDDPGTLTGGLWLIGLDDGEHRRLSENPVTAPEWSPDGSLLLGRDRPDGRGAWSVYDVADGSSTLVEHTLRRGGLGAYYLRFWDQFGRTQTRWSPDGGAFVFPGRLGSGEAGIWIHTSGVDEPGFLAEGDIAFWAPEPS